MLRDVEDRMADNRPNKPLHPRLRRFGRFAMRIGKHRLCHRTRIRQHVTQHNRSLGVSSTDRVLKDRVCHRKIDRILGHSFPTDDTTASTRTTTHSQFIDYSHKDLNPAETPATRTTPHTQFTDNPQKDLTPADTPATPTRARVLVWCVLVCSSGIRAHHFWRSSAGTSRRSTRSQRLPDFRNTVCVGLSTTD